VSYMLLIVEKPGDRRERSEAEGRELYDRMMQFSESLKARGLLKLSQALRTDKLAVRVEVRDGKRTMIDGPFAEARRWSAASSCSIAKHASKRLRSRLIARRRSGPPSRCANWGPASHDDARARSMNAGEVHRTVEAVWRMESAKIIGALARVLRDVRSRRRARAGGTAGGAGAVAVERGSRQPWRLADRGREAPRDRHDPLAANCTPASRTR